MLLILGGNKEENIRKHQLLTWYHDLFRTDLGQRDTRLMIIGYSFNDAHINKAIIDATVEGNLELFIVDPLGVDVIDKRKSRASSPTELMTRLSPAIVGSSRRQLLSTFNTDLVEHARVMKFFV